MSGEYCLSVEIYERQVERYERQYEEKQLRQNKREEIARVFDKILALLNIQIDIQQSKIDLPQSNDPNYSNALKQTLHNITIDLKILFQKAPDNLINKVAEIGKKNKAKIDLDKHLNSLFLNSDKNSIKSPDITDQDTFNYLYLLLALLKYLFRADNKGFINYLLKKAKMYSMAQNNILIKNTKVICERLQQALNSAAEKHGYYRYQEYDRIINEIENINTNPNLAESKEDFSHIDENPATIFDNSPINKNIVIFPESRKYEIEFKSENVEIVPTHLRHKKHVGSGLDRVISFFSRFILPQKTISEISNELEALHSTMYQELKNVDNNQHEQILQQILTKFNELQTQILNFGEESNLFFLNEFYTHFEALNILKKNNDALQSLEEDFIEKLNSFLEEDLKNFDYEAFKTFIDFNYIKIAQHHNRHNEQSKLLKGFEFAIYINDGSYYVHSFKKLFETIKKIEKDLPNSKYEQKLEFIKELDNFNKPADKYFEIYKSIIEPIKNNIISEITTTVKQHYGRLYSEFFDNKKEGSIGLFDTYLQERNKHYFFKDIIVKIFDCFLKCIYMTIFNTVFFADYSEREIYLMELQTKAKTALISNPYNETAMEELKAHIEKGKSFSSKRQNSLSNLLTQLENRLNKIEDPLHAESENQVEKEDEEEITRNLNI